MIDQKQYLEKKTKGLAELVAINNAFAISFSRFDPETGEAASPEVQAISRDEMVKEREALMEKIADIDAMIADMDALKKPKAQESTE